MQGRVPEAGRIGKFSAWFAFSAWLAAVSDAIDAGIQEAPRSGIRS
jgi:hypothetical protein